jgi:hypothetical protein
MTTTYDVTSEGETFGNTDTTTLNGAIRTIDTGAAGNYVIDIAAPIDLSLHLLAINLPTGSTLTIAGTNSSGNAAQIETIDGAGTYNGFFVYSGNVTNQDLTLQNMKAQGGAGMDGGGGGAGLGGGLFIAAAGNVTLTDVSFSSDAAVGGAAFGADGGGGGGGT